MLSKTAVSALSKVGKVHQRSFSLGGVRLNELPCVGVKNSMDVTEAATPQSLSQELKEKYYPQIGNREIVGPSYGAQFDYHDTADHPMPSVRWAANTPEVLALREKELNDWNTLTLEEKKQLYRNTYRQTFAEFKAPTGDWKRIASIVFYTLAASVVLFLYNVTSYGTKPVTYDQDYQQGMIATMLMSNVAPYSGISSKYDFEKNEWKK
ncbi:cytochrome c oxidase subunit 4 isoform 1, mitochondrial-like isoform X2 [Mercenaria mercenaria]|nr:cytochrome c oxidase subunit 4 isoform 1, mitochondrial-like isoform X2 [Mercenaria mercenaria]